MKYKNAYNSIIERVNLPKKINDDYVKSRMKQQDGKDAYTIEYSWGICGKKVNKMDLSELSKDSFKKLSFDENTVFSKEQSIKFNPNLLLQKGKKFGLGLDKLHKVGLNGDGISVAIIDWTFDLSNQEMIDEQGNSKIALYDDSLIQRDYIDDDGFHGKTVSSLLVGSTVGVAPKSKLFYFSSNQIHDDSETSTILDKIKLLNEQGANIQLVSMSSSLRDDKVNDNYTDQMHKQNCELISSRNFWKQGFNYMCRDNYKDIDDSNNFELENSAERDFSEELFEDKLRQVKNHYEQMDTKIHVLYVELENSKGAHNSELLNQIRVLEEEQSKIKPFLEMSYQDFVDLRKKSEQKSVYVPCGGRTYPQIGNDGKYTYCGHGSASWTIPQVAGLFAISRQMDPNLTFEEFSEISKSSAIKNNKGYLVINPEGIVREIDTRNKIKSQSGEEYKKIYMDSQKYISKLDAIKDISLGESLQDKVNNNCDFVPEVLSPKKESDITR